MLEKFKNFIYDISDILLSLIIIIIMVLTIMWKISDTMNISLRYNPSEVSSETTVETTNNTDVINENTNQNSNETETSTNADTPTNEDNSSSEDNSNLKEEKEDTIKIVPLVPENIVVEIPKGSTGVGIAKILKNKRLISSTSDFINRVEELKLAPKLRFGTFTIKSDSSIDEIIYILTGVKKSN